jgi:hypothetical protein
MAAPGDSGAAYFDAGRSNNQSTLVVEDNTDDQETTMPVRQATPSQLNSIKRAIDRLGERGDAGRALRGYLVEQLDPDNADRSVRCSLKNLEGAIREMRDELRSIMH